VGIVTKKEWFCLVGALVAAGSLGACGGGSGGGSSVAIDLESEEGVKRELSNLGTIVDAALLEVVEFDDVFIKRTTRANGNGLGALRRKSSGITFECSDGGRFDNVIEDQRDENLRFFGLTKTVDIFGGDQVNCREIEGDTTFTYNGFFIDGEDQFITQSSTTYEFVESGKGNTPERIRIEQASSNTDVTARILGRFEAEYSNTLDDTRIQGNIDINGRVGGERVNLSMVFGGSGAEAFRIAEDFSNDTLILDGTYQYRNGGCAGGQIVVSTPEAVTISDEGFPSSGSFTITHEGETATYTFSGDTVTYTTQGGLSGAFSVAEIDEDQGC
jgi:hypothetical protein